MNMTVAKDGQSGSTQKERRMKSIFECCDNCVHHVSWEETEIFNHLHQCRINQKEISHPCFMGGSKRCECYERQNKQHKQPKMKFEYPKMTDVAEKEEQEKIRREIERWKREDG